MKHDQNKARGLSLSERLHIVEKTGDLLEFLESVAKLVSSEKKAGQKEQLSKLVVMADKKAVK